MDTHCTSSFRTPATVCADLASYLVHHLQKWRDLREVMCNERDKKAYKAHGCAIFRCTTLVFMLAPGNFLTQRYHGKWRHTSEFWHFTLVGDISEISREVKRQLT